jgi:hypothetical protein
MKKLIALTQLSGNYGVAQAGQEFETDDDTARELLRRGYVKHAADPEVVYETKVIVPQEAPKVSARRPFRHGAVRDPQSPPMDTENAPVVPPADISKP